MARTYMEVLGTVTPAAGGAKRVRDIVAALAPPVRTGGPAALVRTDAGSKAPTVKDAAVAVVPGVLGGAVGAYAWKNHRILGFLVGHAVASTVHPLVTGKKRKEAMFQLGVEGAGIAGALAWKKHPFFGWLAGGVAGMLATGLIKSSPTRALYDKWKTEG